VHAAGDGHVSTEPQHGLESAGYSQ
jgi:hypothetical protein